ncbi:hypothetical protein LUZ60_008818 [Juncus effusus]|nr:hypothetical protein LUZ60_008818 [Juncus effusus]
MALASFLLRCASRRLLLHSKPLHFLSASPLPLRLSFSTYQSDFEHDPDEHLHAKSLSISDFESFLQLISCAKSLSPSKKEALSFLKNSESVEPSRELVCKALWELREDWEAALLCFRWGEESVLNCAWAWHFIIHLMGKNERFHMAWYLVRKMRRNGVLTSQAMIIMMQRYADANQPSKAIKTFHNMEKFKLSPDSEVFTSVLTALCKNKNIEEAEEFLLTNKKYFPLNSENFNIILHGWCEIMPDLKEAKRVWREMANYCITPDKNSYSHMISCYSKFGNLFDSLRLFDEMKKRKWDPPLEAYNSLIYILTKENCLKDAKNIFNKIYEAGFNPNVETYNNMIIPLCESGKLEEAREVFDEMRAKTQNPNVETFHAFLKGEEIDEIINILRKMKENKCGPYDGTFLVLLEKFFGSNQAGNALKIWYEMRKYDINPYRSHYILLVQGLVKYGWIVKAMEFYNEMKNKGFERDLRFEKLFRGFLERNKDHWQRPGNNFAFFEGVKRNFLSKGENT